METIQLNNGLTINFTDETRRYYGSFYRVCIRVTCAVPVAAHNGNLTVEEQQLRSTYGDSILYERLLEKMGVPEKELEKIKEHLLTQFNQTSLPYLNDPEFPCRYVAKFIADKKRKRHIRL